MSRRSHVMEIGCIACDDLGSVGAGESEEWLSDPGILTALHLHAIAIAIACSSRSLIIVLGWDPSSPLSVPIKIRPSIASSDGKITAVEWIGFGDLLVLAVGTSGGFLLIFSVEGDLIHKQIIFSAHMLRLRFHETKGGSLQETDSQELSIVTPGVIARFDGSDIQSRSRIWEDMKDPEDESSFGRIPFQLWNVGKCSSCADAATVGLLSLPLLELQLSEATLVLHSAPFIAGQSSQRYYCAVSIGEDAVISAYRLSVDRSRSLVRTILSKVVPATFSKLASFSKMIWRSDRSSNKKSHVPSQSFAKASPLTCLKDPPGKGERLTLSPSGPLVAITDSLGRILLLDTRALVVVRLWKLHQAPLPMNIPKVIIACVWQFMHLVKGYLRFFENWFMHDYRAGLQKCRPTKKDVEPSEAAR